MINITGPKGDRQVKEGKPFRLAEGESVVGSTQERRRDVLDTIGQAKRIGVGDLLTRVTTETGFKRWWQQTHKGQCMKCQRREAALNYFQFKGPEWLHDWVEGPKKETDESSTSSDTDNSSNG